MISLFYLKIHFPWERGTTHCVIHSLFSILSEFFSFCEELIELGFFKSKEGFWKKNIKKVKNFTSKIKKNIFWHLRSRGRSSVAMYHANDCYCHHSNQNRF